jgi:hypothetical protein
MPIGRILRAITGRTRRRNRVTPGQASAEQVPEVTAQRTARQTRRTQRQGLKQIAKDYVNDIKNIRTQLKSKRTEYEEAVSQNQPQAILEIIKNEFRAIARTWPRFTGNVRVQGDPTARPYPEDNVIKKIGLRDKINIVKTSLLVEREINERSRLDVAEAVLETMSSDTTMFKNYLRTHLSPPGYPNVDEDEDEYNREAWEDDESPNPRYGRSPERAPGYDALPTIPQGTRRRSMSPSTPPPRYSPGGVNAGGYKKKRKGRKNKTRRY